MSILSVSALVAADTPPPSNEALEKTIRQYILDHPEVVMEAIQRYQAREQAARAQRAKDALVARASELYRDPTSPVAGASNDPFSIVEFFDYRCGFCKHVDPMVLKVLDENPSIRVVFKEFPILGAESLMAAKAGLAANRQGGYLKFHKALMSETGSLTPDTIARIATQLGLDVAKLKADMELPEVTAVIEHNRKLAEALQVNATPIFVIGGEIVPGVVDAADLQARIAKAQAGK